MTKIISVANNKGGVGKTTATINIGKSLALLNKKVLLIDLDPQGNLSQSFGVFPKENELVINSILGGTALYIQNVSENLFVAPTDIRMGKFEQELLTKTGADRRLKLTLDKTLKQEHFDYVLIDCPPSLGIFTNNALTASNFVVIPMQAEMSSYYGIENLLEKVVEVQEIGNAQLEILGLFFNMVANKSIHKSMIEQIKEKYEIVIPICETIIAESKFPKEAQLMEQTLVEYAPNEKITINYQQLTKELLNLS